MPTAYPVALDVLNNPSASDSLDTPGVFHDVQHSDANDAIEAIQAKIGVDGSAIVTTLDYLVKKSNVVISPAAATVPWTVRGAAGQTADLQRWQSSASVNLVRITGTGDVLVAAPGRLAVGGAVLASTGVSIYADGVAVVPLRLRGFAGQTAALQEWQDSAGAVVALVRPDGNVGATLLSTLANTGPYLSPTATTMIHFNRTTVTNVPLTVRGMAGQTGDLQRWEDSAAAILARISSAGGGVFQGFNGLGTAFDSYLGGGAAVATATLTVNAGAAARIPVIVKGAASQSGNLQQWRSSADAVLASVSSAGVFTFPAAQYGTVVAQTTYGAASTSGVSALIARADHAHGTPPQGITGIAARRNSGTATTPRPQYNFIEGTGIALAVVDDAGGGEVEITVSTAGALGELDPLLYMGGF
jgi:hypothetical protein